MELRETEREAQTPNYVESMHPNRTVAAQI